MVVHRPVTEHHGLPEVSERLATREGMLELRRVERVYDRDSGKDHNRE